MNIKNLITYDVRPDPQKYPYSKDVNFQNIYVNLYYNEHFLGQGIFEYQARNWVKFIGFKIGRVAPYLSLTWDELSQLAIKHLRKNKFHVITSW